MSRHWRAPQAPSTHPVVDWLIAFAALCAESVFIMLIFMVAVRSQEVIQYRMTWTAGVNTPRGPAVGDIQETTKFKSEGDCKIFGEAMTPRLRDWVRGRFAMDWHAPVAVKFRCDTDGGAT